MVGGGGCLVIKYSKKNLCHDLLCVSISHCQQYCNAVRKTKGCSKVSCGVFVCVHVTYNYVFCCGHSKIVHLVFEDRENAKNDIHRTQTLFLLRELNIETCDLLMFQWHYVMSESCWRLPQPTTLPSCVRLVSNTSPSTCQHCWRAGTCRGSIAELSTGLGCDRNCKHLTFGVCLFMISHLGYLFITIGKGSDSSIEDLLFGLILYPLYPITACALLTLWTSAARVAYCFTQKTKAFFPLKKKKKKKKKKNLWSDLNNAVKLCARQEESFSCTVPKWFVWTYKSSEKRRRYIWIE